MSADAVPRARAGARSAWAWVVFLLGVLLLPRAALRHARVLAARPSRLFAAYTNSFADPKFFGEPAATRSWSALMTIVVSLAADRADRLLGPAQVPRAAAARRVRDAAAVRHPAGRARVRADPHLQPAAAAAHRTPTRAATLLLVGGYVMLSLPYMYRAIDTGLAAIDVRTLTEAAQSLGAGWPRSSCAVILPEHPGRAPVGAFLTLAIVIGEFTIASFLARPAFGPYLSLLGANQGLRARRRVAHQLRADLAGDDRARLPRPRLARHGSSRRRALRSRARPWASSS